LALTLAFIVLFSSLGLPFANAQEFHKPGKANEKLLTSPEKNQIPGEVFLLNFCEEEDVEDDDKLSFYPFLFRSQNALLFIFNSCKSNLLFITAPCIFSYRIFLLTRKIRV
ncbi:MAG: hypothetical protein AB7P01_15350, partial [Bacteroidia bacterium]